MRWIITLVAFNFVFTGTPAIGLDPPDRGKEIYDRCIGCHSPDRDRTGPRHCGLFGRKAGSVPGFTYSDAMQNSDIIWSRKTLDVFLENPIATVPGTLMGYAGVTDARERAELIAYLERINQSDECAHRE